MVNPTCVSSSTQSAPKLNARTPPERRGALLLTPPASTERRVPLSPSVEDLVKFLGNYRDSTADAQEASIKLRPSQFQQLAAALRADLTLDSYVKDKLRLDYDPTSGVLLVRMPTPIHDFFATSVVDEIYGNLKRIAAQPDVTGDFAAQIRNGGSSRILLKEDMEEDKTSTAGHVWQRHPDGQFQHRKAAYPGVVVEISYSQDGKDLRKLAWQYIQLSNGDIKAVIGIDVNDAPKSSTVSIWRAKCVREDEEDILDVEQDIAYQPFRSSNGTLANAAQAVRLLLQDFAPDELCKGLEATELHITCARLAELLSQAEEMQTIREHVSNSGVRSSRRNKRPPPLSSSPDRLLPEDEAQFRLDEERTAEK